ncbi:MAG: hypothetical protein ONB05_02910, partial [candidate division KSB1 bacterium]|nr:hypothetical protein [candidate division KSB1 bacterium]
KNAGVLKSSREGTWVYYWLNREGSPLLQDLFQVLSRHLHQEVFEGDAHRLELRLLLREEGACVVGFVSERELKKRIREKGIEVG